MAQSRKKTYSWLLNKNTPSHPFPNNTVSMFSHTCKFSQADSGCVSLVYMQKQTDTHILIFCV